MAFCVGTNPVVGCQTYSAFATIILGETDINGNWGFGAVAIGYNAGGKTTATGRGVYIGTSAGSQKCGDESVYIGYLASCAHAGYCDVVIGVCANMGVLSAGNAITTRANVIIGNCAVTCNTSPCCSTVIGYNAMGVSTGPSNTAPLGVVAVGWGAGRLVCCNYHALIGWAEGNLNTTNGNINIADHATSTICVWGQGSTGFFGIKCCAPPVRLSVAGALNATGEIIAYYSDRRLKENIIVIDCALDRISKINGITYNPNNLAKNFGFDTTCREVGLLADEVEAEFPELVTLAPFDMTDKKESKSGENYKTIKYERLTPIMVQAIKELIDITEELEKELESI